MVTPTENRKALIDITKINIELNEPPIQRLIRFMYSMENPYSFRVGKTSVKIVFQKRNTASIQKCLENIVSRQNQ